MPQSAVTLFFELNFRLTRYPDIGSRAGLLTEDRRSGSGDAPLAIVAGP